jgi:hypothetical protein
MSDRRTRWFHDPNLRAGRAIAASLGASGKVAWDVYLFYAMGVRWKDLPPTPLQWVHQLSDSWADQSHHHFGDQLEPELGKLLRSLLGQSLAA